MSVRTSSGYANVTGNTPALNTWSHVAFVCSGSTVSVYLNGILIGTNTDSGTWYSTGTVCTVGAAVLTGTSYYAGYISNLRVLNGTALYTSNFIAPVLPLTAITNTSLLLANSNADVTQFLDQSGVNAVTPAGNVSQGTFSPYNTNWSNYFDGSTGYLITANSSTFALPNSTNWTVEVWYFQPTRPASVVLGFLGGGTANNWGVHDCDFAVIPSGYLLFEYSTGSGVIDVNGTTVVPVGQWNHIAYVYNGSAKTITTYLNGVVDMNAVSVSAYNPPSSSPRWTIGRTDPVSSTGFYLNGNLSNFRVVNYAVYLSNFSVPTSPLTAIPGTALLTCQSNRFVNNANANTITANGTVVVQPFSPINPTSAYGTTNGGSLYFNGSTGNYLSLPYTAALFDWWTLSYTIEMWVYNLSNLDYHVSSNPHSPLQIGNMQPTSTGNQWAFGTNASGLNTFAYWNGSAVVAVNGSAVIPLNTWTHIAMTCVSNTIKLWTNGVLDATASISGTPNSYNTTPFTIGQWNTAYNGYIGCIRINKGFAVYSTAFTPPTTQPVALPSTTLLIDSDNINLYDATTDTDIALYGNAVVSTANNKFNPNLYFDGSATSTYAATSSSFSNAFGTANFTIECWYYPVSNSTSYPQILSTQGPNTWAANNWNLYDRHTSYPTHFSFWFYNYSSTVPLLVSSAVPSNNTWYHLAVVRNGNTFSLYINGSLDTSVTSSAALNALAKTPLYIGGGLTTGTLHGYVEDARTSKFARYVSNFSVPTAALPAY